MATVGLALIAKNEEANLPVLLASIEGVFDQIVLCDTGSTDGTEAVFQLWAADQKDLDYKVIHFEWCHDFSAARAFAQGHLTTDWEVWADCDDEIRGAQNIRGMIEHAPPDLAAFICGYNYAQTPEGQCLCYLKRERIVRRGTGVWIGRVHEAQVVHGPAQFVDPQIIEWHHRKSPQQMEVDKDSNRNLTILKKWHKDEPENTRVLAYLGTEYAARGEHERAVEYYNAYLALNPDWKEEHAQVCRKVANSLFELGRDKEARDKAFRAQLVEPRWPDSYLTLADYHLRIGEFANAIFWADKVLEIGVPDTVLIVNPMEYTWLPRKIKAAALLELGDHDSALALAKEAMSILPEEGTHRLLAAAQSVAKREHTAETFALACEQLIAHDEQLKALKLIEECVPHFAQDHPRVVAIRSMLRERLMWLDAGYTDYYRDASQPEDQVTDEKVDHVCGVISRTQFLVAELDEQYEEMRDVVAVES